MAANELASDSKESGLEPLCEIPITHQSRVSVPQGEGGLVMHPMLGHGGLSPACIAVCGLLYSVVTLVHVLTVSTRTASQ